MLANSQYTVTTEEAANAIDAIDTLRFETFVWVPGVQDQEDGKWAW